jgi:two-component SAPR family response regulator
MIYITEIKMNKTTLIDLSEKLQNKLQNVFIIKNTFISTYFLHASKNNSIEN